jgi:hypothetical protein
MTRGKSVAAADEPTSSGSRGVRLLSKRSNPGGLCRGSAGGRCRTSQAAALAGGRCRWAGARVSAAARARRGTHRVSLDRAPGLEDPWRSRQMPHTARGGATRGATRAAASACRPGQLVRRRRGALGVEQRAVARHAVLRWGPTRRAWPGSGGAPRPWAIDGARDEGRVARDRGCGGGSRAASIAAAVSVVTVPRRRGSPRGSPAPGAGGARADRSLDTPQASAAAGSADGDGAQRGSAPEALHGRVSAIELAAVDIRVPSEVGAVGMVAGAISRRRAVMATGWPRPRRSSPTRMPGGRRVRRRSFSSRRSAPPPRPSRPGLRRRWPRSRRSSAVRSSGRPGRRRSARGAAWPPRRPGS